MERKDFNEWMSRTFSADFIEKYETSNIIHQVADSLYCSPGNVVSLVESLALQFESNMETTRDLLKNGVPAHQVVVPYDSLPEDLRHKFQAGEIATKRKALVVWRNRFPFQGDIRSLEIENWVDLDPSVDFPALEAEAILDTPEGYFLHRIHLPDVTYRYDKEGTRVEIKATSDILTFKK